MHHASALRASCKSFFKNETVKFVKDFVKFEGGQKIDAQYLGGADHYQLMTHAECDWHPLIAHASTRMQTA